MQNFGSWGVGWGDIFTRAWTKAHQTKLTRQKLTGQKLTGQKLTNYLKKLTKVHQSSFVYVTLETQIPS